MWLCGGKADLVLASGTWVDSSELGQHLGHEGTVVNYPAEAHLLLCGLVASLLFSLVLKKVLKRKQSDFYVKTKRKVKSFIIYFYFYAGCISLVQS